MMLKLCQKVIKRNKGIKILNIVNNILSFTLKEWKKKKKKIGKGLKILTPDQMFGRLPITLAQLKAWNYSEKLKKWN